MLSLGFLRGLREVRSQRRGWFLLERMLSGTKAEAVGLPMTQPEASLSIPQHHRPRVLSVKDRGSPDPRTRGNRGPDLWEEQFFGAPSLEISGRSPAT